MQSMKLPLFMLILIGFHLVFMAELKNDDLYLQLWKLCAGPLAYVPSAGDKILYFPQGHMELLQASRDHELNQEIPHFYIPSKILCRVVNIRLLAEEETDEVYACITLLPEQDQTELILVPGPNPPPESPHEKFQSFRKILAACDTRNHGGFLVLQKHAAECLPPLDMSRTIPTQELLVKDVHDFEWKFTHVYGGEPKRHMLTTGWSEFVSSEKLIAGDAIVFLRGESGHMRVGIRRMALHQSHIPSSKLVLAVASHAFMSKTLFTVCYKPRISRFIVDVNKYMEGVNNELIEGMSFKMGFEGEDLTETRFSGTIVEIGDVSEWRSLKVEWDEPTMIARPERVSPWEIETLLDSKGKNSGFWHHGSSEAEDLAHLGGDEEVEANCFHCICFTFYEVPQQLVAVHKRIFVSIKEAVVGAWEWGAST